MKKQLTKVAFTCTCLLGLSALLSPVSATELYKQSEQTWGANAAAIQGREYKFLVDPTKMPEEPSKAFQQLWKDAKNVFEKQGLVVEEKDKKPFKLSGQVKTFYDTKDLDLWKKGYLIRATNRIKVGTIEDETKLVFKRINRPDNEVIASPLTLVKGNKKAEAEDNVSQGSDGKLVSYVEKGVSTKVSREDLGTLKLKDFSQFFTQLNELGLAPDTQLVAYSGYGERVKPGYVHIPGAEPSEISMECWAPQPKAKSIVCDYSFGYEGAFVGMNKAHEAGEKAIAALHNELGEKYGLKDGRKFAGSKARVLLNQPKQ